MSKLIATIALAFVSVSAVAMPLPAPPVVQAKSYAVMDFQSGDVLFGDHADERVEPASITKVMTVYIAFDAIKKGRLKLDDTALVSEKAWRQGIDSSESRMFLEVGTRVKIADLLRGIIIASGNDASIALSEHIAGSETVFADMMNQYAQQLGMKNTHFADASGLPDPNHYTTARDLTLLARALIRDFPDLYGMFAEKSYQYSGAPKVKAQPNRNGLLFKDPSVDGIKTGHTNAAGYCLLSSAKRNDRRLIVAVMGAPTWAGRESASLELLNFGFQFYDTVPLFGPTAPITTARAWKGAEDQVPLGVSPQLMLSLPRGARERLTYAPQITERAVAPIAAGQKFGVVNVTLDGRVIRTVDLVALKDIPQGGLFTRMVDSVRMLISR